jgi:ATP adenylyltransferase
MHQESRMKQEQPGQSFVRFRIFYIGALSLEHIWSPWRMEYIQSSKNEAVCVFCVGLSAHNDEQNLIVFRGERVFVILNRYPYTSGHVMIVPFDHKPSLEGIDGETRAEMMELATKATSVLGEIYQAEGFNLGINIGEAAGAGIAGHVHMHVVPRWFGDTNFMSTLGSTRVLPESLEESYRRIQESWQHVK